MPSAESGQDSDPEASQTNLPASAQPSSASASALGAAPPSSIAPSSSPRRASEHVAWGAVRDAITAIHNLEVLLKSPRIGTKVLAGVLNEFLEGVAVLRGAFSKASKTAKTEAMVEARHALAELARVRLDELERTMQRAMTSDFDARGRLALEKVVTRVSVDLDAAAELLDLSDRAEHAMETELSLAELAKVSLQGGAYGTDHAVPVRLVLPRDSGVLRADPHVFKRLVAFSIARVHAAGAPGVSLRVHCGLESVRIEIAPTTSAEQSLAATSLRLVRRLEPTDAIVEAAAGAAAIVMIVGAGAAGGTISFDVPRVG